jgi:RimJ/RimL family protein N-acetyltransferase
MTSHPAPISWPIRTARLSIRPATAIDVEPTWQYRREPSVHQWMTSAPATFDEYTEKFLDPSRLEKTLVIERDGEVIGDLMLSVEDAWGQTEVADRAKRTQAEIGFCLHPAHEGQGLATEAVAELLRVCFEEIGLRRVTGNCFADNAPSWRLMERMGMRREQHSVKDSLHRSGEWLDGYGYALLAEEWQARTNSGR